MKTTIVTLLSAVTLTCVPVSVRADDVSSNPQLSRDRDEAAAFPTQRLGDLKRSHEIIGREIVDAHDTRLGKVKDLALDLQNGRVAEVIVATSGALGMDQKLVAIPPTAFSCDRTMKNLRFTADESALKNAPEFKISQWNDSTQYVEIRETYQRFNAAPYFIHDQQPGVLTPPSPHAVENYYSFDGEHNLPHLGLISRETRLVGTTTLNSLDERLGKVDDFVLDLPAGRIVEVVLSTGGFLGVGANLRAVPPEAFHWNTNFTVLNLESTSEAFKVAPHFKSTEWGYALEPATISEVYESYHVRPYFVTSDTDLGAEKVRTRSQDVPTPLDRSGKADDDITAQVHKNIMDDNNIASLDAKHVNIMTVDGKVTLVGPVDTDEEKRLIGEAAAKVVSADKVDNQLQVHATHLYATPPAPDSDSTDQAK